MLRVVTLAAAVVVATAAAARENTLVYVGGYTGGEAGGKGIYLFELRDGADGPKLKSRGLVAETENPAFLAIDVERLSLFAVGETSRFEGRPTGSVSAFQIDATTGDLTLINRQSSRGAGPCHVILDQAGQHVLVANYGDGSVAVLPVAEDGRLGEATAIVQHSGSSVNRDRQAGPHAHCLTLDPSGKLAFVCDLGLDQVLAYKFDAEHGTLAAHDPPLERLKPGAGPRHMAFHPSGKFAYVVNELNSTVTAFAFDAATGALDEIQSITTLPEGYAEPNTTAEIAVHLSGQFLYASNRGADSIACFTVDPASGKLTHLANQPTGGRTPRYFGISPAGYVMIIANQNSHTLVTCRIGANGRLAPVGEPAASPTPSCVVFLPPDDGAAKNNGGVSSSSNAATPQ
jgi:6-phosphogluconolactonase